MKIAYVVGAYPVPSEQFIQREIDALAAAGADITLYPVVCNGEFACPLCVLGKHAWLSVLPSTWRAVARFPFSDLVRLCGKAWAEFPGGLSRAAAYARDARGRGIEHIHAHFATKPAAVGAMIAAMTRLPLTISVHARDVFAEGVALRHKVAAASRVVCCNRAAMGHLAARLPEPLRGRLALIRHGIDVSEYEFRPDRELHRPARLFAAGRFVEKKGFRYLLDAMTRLGGCVCEIAGDGPLADDLRRQAKWLGIETRVSFLGWLGPDALRTKMATADVLVAPAVVARDGDRDGVPNVVVEAAAIGLPIVACDAGAVGEFVRDGETGRLVAPRNPAAIALAIRSLLADRDGARRLAENARKRVEKEYNLRENMKLLMDVFVRPEQGNP